MKWTVVFLAAVQFGFMAYDGMRALTTGDYLRPASGKHAGQLGPWSRVVRGAGIDPESTPMKLIFVFLGTSGLVITVGFALGWPGTWKALLAANVCSLWYLFPGTVTALLQIILLIAWYRVQQGASGT